MRVSLWTSSSALPEAELPRAFWDSENFLAVRGESLVVFETLQIVSESNPNTRRHV
jgi:hypothetical protein